MHQQPAACLAAVRKNPESFEAGLALVARRLLFSAVGLSDGDRQFLHDVTRSEARFPMRALQRLVAISRRSVQPDDREALPELIRREILGDESAMTVAAAFDFETSAQGEADMAQRRYERNRQCPAARAAAIQFMTRHLIGLKHSIVAVHAGR